MRKVVVLSLAIVLMALSVGQTVSAADAYTDPDGRVSFTPPDGYQQFSEQEINQFAQAGATFTGASGRTSAARTAIITGYRDPLTMANFTVSTVPLPTPDAMLDDFIQATQDQLASARLITFMPSDTQDATIGDEAARYFDYMVLAGSVSVRGRQYYTIHNSAVYILTLTASDDTADQALGDMQVVVDSFMFLQ